MTKTTVEMLDLYARVRAIEQAGQDETWEVDGGRRREYFDLQVELHRLLGRQIWEAHVFLRGPHRSAASDVAEWESAQASRDTHPGIKQRFIELATASVGYYEHLYGD
jgi:hypothetical protein